MIKIFIKKNDGVDEVAEQIAAAPDLSLVLVIPRFSKLNDSLAHFHRLKKEAEGVGKKIVIESVDDHVLSLAKASHIESLNPFFGDTARAKISDIVHRSKGSLAENEEDKEVGAEGEEMLAATAHDSRRGKRKKRSAFRKAAYIIAGAAITVGLAVIAEIVLPKAEIVLTAQKAAWEYHDTLAVDKAGTEVAGQVFSTELNQSFSFPATGKKKVEQKAAGVIMVYNAYGTDSQYLVATTRFMSPDGKIFRLDKGATIPGAKLVNGTLVPSSVTLTVTADKPGADYNIEPTDHFSIPGFQGTPRYKSFYGESKAPMAGGLVGDTAFILPDDLKNAKQTAEQKMRKNIEVPLLAQIDSNFHVIASSSQFTVVKENPVEVVAADGTFSIFIDAKMDVMAFRTDDAIAVLTAKAQKELGREFKLANYDLSFGPAQIDFAAGKANVPTQFKGNFAYAIDISNFKPRAAGKNESALAALVKPMPGVAKATVKLWPFWVFHVPNNQNKITVTIE